jgi:hypothetical protein
MESYAKRFVFEMPTSMVFALWPYDTFARNQSVSNQETAMGFDAPGDERDTR